MLLSKTHFAFNYLLISLLSIIFQNWVYFPMQNNQRKVTFVEQWFSRHSGNEGQSSLRDGKQKTLVLWRWPQDFTGQSTKGRGRNRNLQRVLFKYPAKYSSGHIGNILRSGKEASKKIKGKTYIARNSVFFHQPGWKTSSFIRTLGSVLGRVLPD